MCACSSVLAPRKLAHHTRLATTLNRCKNENIVCLPYMACHEAVRQTKNLHTRESMKLKSAGSGSLMRKRRWNREPLGSLIRHAVVADSSAGGSGGRDAAFSCKHMPILERPIHCSNTQSVSQPFNQDGIWCT